MMTGLCLLLVLLLAGQQLLHSRQLNAQIAEAAAERASLLDRIQHPQVKQVDGAPEPHEAQPMTATDLELSFVGGEVPVGVSVGSLRADVEGARGAEE
jgi:hypothetical protein